MLLSGLWGMVWGAVWEGCSLALLIGLPLAGYLCAPGEEGALFLTLDSHGRKALRNKLFQATVRVREVEVDIFFLWQK